MTRRHRAKRLRYDGTAATWRAAYGSPDPFGRRLQRRRNAVVAALHRRLRGRRIRILDAGCGTGEVAQALRADGHEVVALDASEDMLRGARRLLHSDPPASAAFVRGSVCSLPIQSASFEAVLCVGVLGHLLRGRSGGEIVDTAALALRELMRVLRPGGFLVVSVPNLLRVSWLVDPRELRRALGHRARIHASEEGHAGPGATERRLAPRQGTRRWTPREWRRFVEAQGLGIVDCQGVGFGPFSLFGRRILSPQASVRLSARIERLAAVLKPLSWLGAHWVTTLSPTQVGLVDTPTEPATTGVTDWDLRFSPASALGRAAGGPSDTVTCRE